MFHLSHRISPRFMRRLARLLVVPLVALALGLRLPLAAHAAGTIVVDSLGDKQAADGRCTLREAIITANTNAPVDTCAAGGNDVDIITFSISGTIALSTMLPTIREPLTIRGPGADRLTISGSNAVPILYVAELLNLENVTVANGNASDGGGIANHGWLNVTNSIFSHNRATAQSGCDYWKDHGGGSACSYHGGGAIFNDRGTVDVTGSTFTGNLADTGGAIYNHGGNLNITGSVFSGNSASGMSGGGGIKSDAVLTNDGFIFSGWLNVTSSTFSGNSATSGNGGGIDGYELSLTNSTFVGNRATSGNGGGINSYVSLSVTNSTFVTNNAAVGGSLYAGQNSSETILKNTIIADSAGGNCGGPIVLSGTDNLVTDASCGPGAKETSSTALRLGPLQDNGGGTQTIAPQAGSVAIDAGDPATCAAEPVSNRDQRGEVRPQGIGCDVGAVEVKPSYYPPVAKDDSYTTVANPAQLLSVDAAHGLLPNDDDQDGDTLQAVLSSEPSHGKLALNADGSFTYIPSSGFAGSDSFTYRASDGSRESDAASVTIIVGIVAAAADSYSTAQDMSLTIDTPGVLANDAQADGKPLLAQLMKEPSHGKLSLNEDGSFIYTPEGGFAGSDSFDYRATDGRSESNTATVTIAVTP
jgi:CSLREA domain-containing protein